jgi:two-component system cell cycle sensor histidine kinase/response regulator CckA
VLVVEDEPGVRRLTERILSTAGYAVHVAPGGGAALELCEQEDMRIDLLLTAVVMPEMLGPDLVQRALAIRPQMRVLYMSGYIHQVVGGLDTPHIDQLDFIEKPFTADGLLTGVRAALDPS